MSTSAFRREAESPESRPAVRVPEARPFDRAVIYALIAVLLAGFWGAVAAGVLALVG